jgi:hypothetical protein
MRAGLYLKASSHEAQIDVPQQSAAAEEDDPTLHGTICRTEEIGNGPDLVRVENYGPHFLIQS